jgi:hypothetical protein
MRIRQNLRADKQKTGTKQPRWTAALLSDSRNLTLRRLLKIWAHFRRDQRAIIVLLPKKYQFKISDSCVGYWDNAHLLGCLGQAVAARGGHRNRARDWRGLATAQGRVAARRRGRSAKARSPGKPGFLRSKKCAQIILCKKKHYIGPPALAPHPSYPFAASTKHFSSRTLPHFL